MCVTWSLQDGVIKEIQSGVLLFLHYACAPVPVQNQVAWTSSKAASRVPNNKWFARGCRIIHNATWFGVATNSYDSPFMCRIIKCNGNDQPRSRPWERGWVMAFIRMIMMFSFQYAVWINCRSIKVELKYIGPNILTRFRQGWTKPWPNPTLNWPTSVC